MGNEFCTEIDMSNDTSGMVSTHFILVLLEFGHQIAGSTCCKSNCYTWFV